MSISEPEAKKIIRDYYVTFYPGLEHVYPEHLKGQVDFIYNSFVRESNLEKYLKEYQILAEKHEKAKGII